MFMLIDVLLYSLVSGSIWFAGLRYCHVRAEEELRLRGESWISAPWMERMLFWVFIAPLLGFGLYLIASMLVGSAADWSGAYACALGWSLAGALWYGGIDSHADSDTASPTS